MKRKVVVDGGWHLIECAVTADGRSPAAEFLAALEQGMWEDDPNDRARPSDEQVWDFAKLMDLLHEFAKHGDPPGIRQVEYLDGGVWEFKVGDKRVTFYDVDPPHYAPKGKIEWRDDAERDDPRFWMIPEFAVVLRLGHCFGKTSQRTRPEDVKRAIEVREEDLSHDKQ